MRRLGLWTATAMVVTQVVGVGIFLTPATMMRTMGSLAAALAVWAVMGVLSAAGALCYAELSTRFPTATCFCAKPSVRAAPSSTDG